MPYARSQGLRLHYQVEGDGPPLVCQHGFGDDLESWYELGYVDALKDEYRLILIDARGHGASDKPHEPEAYSFQNVTADVVAVLDDLAIVTAHYFGFSMGGKNGFAMAAYAPYRLRSLIVLGTGASAQDHDPLDRWVALLRQGPDAVPSIWEQDAPLSPALRQRLLSNDLEALIAQRIQRKDPEGFDAILPTLSIPCLLMAGEVDPAYDRVKASSRLIPNATFISFPHLGLACVPRGVVGHAWRDLPLWVPDATQGLLQVDITKATAEGLAFRPLAETLQETLTRGSPRIWFGYMANILWFMVLSAFSVAVGWGQLGELGKSKNSTLVWLDLWKSELVIGLVVLFIITV